jgi:hypothetical protein
VGLDPAIDLGGDRRRNAGLALEGRGGIGGDEQLADAGDGVDVDAEGGGDLFVVPASLQVVLVAHQEDTGVQDLLGGGVAVADELFELGALLGGQANGELPRGFHTGSPGWVQGCQSPGIVPTK